MGFVCLTWDLLYFVTLLKVISCLTRRMADFEEQNLPIEAKETVHQPSGFALDSIDSNDPSNNSNSETSFIPSGWIAFLNHDGTVHFQQMVNEQSTLQQQEAVQEVQVIKEVQAMKDVQVMQKAANVAMAAAQAINRSQSNTPQPEVPKKKPRAPRKVDQSKYFDPEYPTEPPRLVYTHIITEDQTLAALNVLKKRRASVSSADTRNRYAIIAAAGRIVSSSHLRKKRKILITKSDKHTNIFSLLNTSLLVKEWGWKWEF